MASDDVPSPCNDICEMNPQTGYCIGCGRAIDEIINWPKMTNEDKRAVWRELDQRAQEQSRPRSSSKGGE